MSIETRLRETLKSRADQAPDHERLLARVLADAETEPGTTRRPWVVPLLAAAAVLAVVGVGVAVVSDGGTAPSDPSTPGPNVPSLMPGTQELGADGLAFSVPAEWPTDPERTCTVPSVDGVYYPGDVLDCAASYPTDVSSVEVMAAAQALVYVSPPDPAIGEGRPDGDGIVRHPIGRSDGVWVAVVTRARAGLVVRSPDRALVEQIVDSVRAVDDDEALVRPDLMQVTPAEVSPGELVELTYPERTLRGVGFALDELVDGVWERRYYLTAGMEPDWWSVDDAEGRGWDDIGIGGEGPDVLLVPPPATPGDYRICTANAGDDFCATLTIR